MRGRHRHENVELLDDETAEEADDLLDDTANTDSPEVDPTVRLEWCRLPIDDLLARLRDAHRELVDWDRVESDDDTLLDFMIEENHHERERLLSDVAGYRTEVARRLRRARRAVPGLGL